MVLVEWAEQQYTRHTKFVCCYTVSAGMDPEEALYSVTAGTRGTIDSLWTITAFSLPRYDLRDGAALKEFKMA